MTQREEFEAWLDRVTRHPDSTMPTPWQTWQAAQAAQPSEALPKPEQKSKKLVLFNGRPYSILPASLWTDTHVCIAAYSRADAARVCEEVGFYKPSDTELKDFFSTCWGRQMDGIEPVRGLWVCKRNEAPRRILAPKK